MLATRVLLIHVAKKLLKSNFTVTTEIYTTTMILYTVFTWLNAAPLIVTPDFKITQCNIVFKHRVE